METIVKFNHSKMREDIKTKAEEQKFLKNQRKTVKLVGERKVEPSVATYRHQTNREDLRVMYAAYGVARGHSFSRIENHYPEENHPLNKYINAINKCIEFHTKNVEEKVEI